MTQGLERWYGGHNLHFITCSCYHRQPRLGTPERRDLFLRVLEQARRRYRFVVSGYVVMPEHFHLLITEPEVGDPSVVMKVIKERFTKLLRRSTGAPLIPGVGMSGSPPNSPTERIWQKRFYDFNVARKEKHIEKLRYMHRNPVKRGLVAAPEDWKWSSFRSYAFNEEGLVRMNVWDWPLKATFSPDKMQTFQAIRTHSSQNRG